MHNLHTCRCVEEGCNSYKFSLVEKEDGKALSDLKFIYTCILDDPSDYHDYQEIRVQEHVQKLGIGYVRNECMYIVWVDVHVHVYVRYEGYTIHMYMYMYSELVGVHVRIVIGEWVSVLMVNDVCGYMYVYVHVHGHIKLFSIFRFQGLCGYY